MQLHVEKHDAHAIVRVDGKVVRENQGELRSALDDVIVGGTRRIALDLEKVTYMDSAALGCCASVQKSLRAGDPGALVVYNASADIQKVWKMIRLHLLVPIFASEEEALAALAEEAP